MTALVAPICIAASVFVYSKPIFLPASLNALVASDPPRSRQAFWAVMTFFLCIHYYANTRQLPYLAALFIIGLTRRRNPFHWVGQMILHWYSGLVFRVHPIGGMALEVFFALLLGDDAGNQNPIGDVFYALYQWSLLFGVAYLSAH